MSRLFVANTWKIKDGSSSFLQFQICPIVLFIIINLTASFSMSPCGLWFVIFVSRHSRGHDSPVKLDSWVVQSAVHSPPPGCWRWRRACMLLGTSADKKDELKTTRWHSEVARSQNAETWQLTQTDKNNNQIHLKLKTHLRSKGAERRC